MQHSLVWLENSAPHEMTMQRGGRASFNTASFTARELDSTHETDEDGFPITQAFDEMEDVVLPLPAPAADQGAGLRTCRL